MQKRGELLSDERTASPFESCGLAEHEASIISARTNAALGAAKARGVKLGGQRGRPDRMGPIARMGNAASAKGNEDLLPVLEGLRAAGVSTAQ